MKPRAKPKERIPPATATASVARPIRVLNMEPSSEWDWCCSTERGGGGFQGWGSARWWVGMSVVGMSGELPTTETPTHRQPSPCQHAAPPHEPRAEGGEHH